MGWGCSTVGFSVQPPKAAEPGGLLGCSSGCSSAGDRRGSGVPLKLAQVALPISALNPSMMELWVCVLGGRGLCGSQGFGARAGAQRPFWWLSQLRG